MSVECGDDWTNYRQTTSATSSGCVFNFPATADSANDFLSVAIVTFIEQGLVHAPTFLRQRQRAAGGTDAGKLARALR